MYSETTPQEIAARRQAGDRSFVLLDVREKDELALARVGDVLHIPMNDVPARLAELDPEQEIVVMCHHGGRSALIAGFLAKQGFEKVRNLRGGIDAWAREVDSSVGVY